MEYLTKDEIVFINKKTVEIHGGNFVPPFNIHNEEPLNYIIEAIKGEMFGKEIYPEIYQKAGLYMFNINSGHIFKDGNKRTALEAALVFLRLNNYSLIQQVKKTQLDNGKLIPSSGDSTIQILINFALEIAEGKITLEECQLWFNENIEKEK